MKATRGDMRSPRGSGMRSLRENKDACGDMISLSSIYCLCSGYNSCVVSGSGYSSVGCSCGFSAIIFSGSCRPRRSCSGGADASGCVSVDAAAVSVDNNDVSGCVSVDAAVSVDTLVVSVCVSDDTLVSVNVLNNEDDADDAGDTVGNDDVIDEGTFCPELSNNRGGSMVPLSLLASLLLRLPNVLPSLLALLLRLTNVLPSLLPLVKTLSLSVDTVSFLGSSSSVSSFSNVSSL